MRSALEKRSRKARSFCLRLPTPLRGAGRKARDPRRGRCNKQAHNHDELGRFTFADGAGGGGLGGSLTGGPSSVGLGGNGKEPRKPSDGQTRVANSDAENIRARIGGNGPPLENGALLGRMGAIAGRYVFGPLGALISMTQPLNTGELIPPYSGRKTEGILETAEGDYYLRSGWNGPTQSIPRSARGFDILTMTHVERHAAALMRQLGLSQGRVYINNPEVCISCFNLLPRMLPDGATLEVVTPLGSQTFAGRIIP